MRREDDPVPKWRNKRLARPDKTAASRRRRGSRPPEATLILAKSKPERRVKLLLPILTDWA